MSAKIIAIAIGLLVLPFLMTARVLAADSGSRQRILLDDGWRFHLGELSKTAIGQGTPINSWRWTAVPANALDAEHMADPALDTSGGGWKNAATGDEVFHGRVGFAWFRTTLPASDAPVHILRFDCVDDNATVYLNGKKLLTHNGWDDPFDVNLESAWDSGGANQLAVLVENTAGGGGMTKPVYLSSSTGVITDGPVSCGFDDHTWQAVHLPHDFVVDGTFDPKANRGHGYLPFGTGWYRKTFTVQANDIGKSIWIDFDGVYRDSQVWVNGQYLGRHRSGYTSFRYDISKVVHAGGDNMIAVHVDATHTEGWWYEGGGIYRHVWLNIGDPVHVAPWGTLVTCQLPEPTPDKPAPSATVTIKTSVTNESPTEFSGGLRSTITDPDTADTAAAINSAVTIPAGKTVEFTQQVLVDHPILWTLDRPNHLYTLTTVIQSANHEPDTDQTHFGIRTIRFDPNTGFYLNGKPVKIQGVCNHQDFAGLGIAVPDTLEYWRVAKMKEMGANGWRMSHNPPTPALLDACDHLGMLVMDETRLFRDSDEAMSEVADLVHRDRNHPCVIMWSMANEEGLEGSERGGKIFSRMMDVVHQFDTSRPISSAMNSPSTWGKGFSLVEDLQGCNYGSGADYDRMHRDFPNLPMFGSETASTTTTRGEYASDKTAGFVTSYNMTDGSWRAVAERPFMAGSFTWTGFDYKGEPSPYDWPCINSHFGIVDMCGFPKDNYYYFQSWWKPEPIVHLLPHWNWSGREGTKIRVVAFSNCSSVELFLNDKSLGEKPMPKYGHLAWDVKYEAGTVLAKGYDAAKNVTASDKVQTTGPSEKLKLKADRSSLAADGEDLIPVEVDVRDAAGNIVPTSDDLVTFTITGPARIAGVGNGNPSDHDPDHASTRHAFHGKCMVIIGSATAPGKVNLTAAAKGLEAATMDFQSDAAR